MWIVFRLSTFSLMWPSAAACVIDFAASQIRLTWWLLCGLDPVWTRQTAETTKRTEETNWEEINKLFFHTFAHLSSAVSLWIAACWFETSHAGFLPTVSFFHLIIPLSPPLTDPLITSFPPAAVSYSLLSVLHPLKKKASRNHLNSSPCCFSARRSNTHVHHRTMFHISQSLHHASSSSSSAPTETQESMLYFFFISFAFSSRLTGQEAAAGLSCFKPLGVKSTS